MSVLANALPNMTISITDNLYPVFAVLVPLFGLKLAINVGPTIFKRICQESLHSHLSPLMLPIPEDEREYADEHYLLESQYYVECQVCHIDMSDEVYFEDFDDEDVSKHVCHTCSLETGYYKNK